MTPRTAAKLAGERHYFTGKPCPHGHVAMRFTTAGKCVVCALDTNRARKGYFKARYEAKKPEILEQFRQKYPAMRVARIRAAKAWAAANRVLTLGYKQRNKHKRRAAVGAFAARDIARLLDRQRCACAICEASLRDGYHVDHVIALTRGGTNWCGNLQLLCGPCNRHKSNKLPIRFRVERQNELREAA